MLDQLDKADTYRLLKEIRDHLRDIRTGVQILCFIAGAALAVYFLF